MCFSVTPSEFVLDLFERFPLHSGLMSDFQDSMWVVLCHPAMTDKSQEVAVDSNPRRPSPDKCEAGTLTTQSPPCIFFSLISYPLYLTLPPFSPSVSTPPLSAACFSTHFLPCRFTFPFLCQSIFFPSISSRCTFNFLHSLAYVASLLSLYQNLSIISCSFPSPPFLFPISYFSLSLSFHLPSSLPCLPSLFSSSPLPI